MSGEVAISDQKKVVYVHDNELLYYCRFCVIEFGLFVKLKAINAKNNC
jgi:hypothetical protein